MTGARQVLIIAAVALLAVGAGYLAHSSRSPVGEATAPADAGKVLLDASFEGLDGSRQSLAQWSGKVLVVNFWATWCAPCREEIPEFIEFQRQYGDRGVLFVGIAVDQRDPVARFSREFGINYPVLVGNLGALDVARAAGNTVSVLPFTVIVGRDGAIVRSLVGKLDRKMFEAVVLPLL